MYFLGLDLGSSYTKGVIVDSSNEICDHLAIRTGYDFKATSQQIMDHFSQKYEISTPVYTCGYGREQVEFPFVAASEIIALAKAVFKHFPQKTEVIDIGGQDTKYIRISGNGVVEKFKFNRKCAAGTGAFLEEIAFRLNVPPEKFNEFANASTSATQINSFCTVFAVSEIIGLIKEGTPLADIILGIYQSIIKRCEEMAPLQNTLVITGGVPEIHPKIVSLFRGKWPDTENPPLSQFMAAYGCVLLQHGRSGEA